MCVCVCVCVCERERERKKEREREREKERGEVYRVTEGKVSNAPYYKQSYYNVAMSRMNLLFYPLSIINICYTAIRLHSTDLYHLSQPQLTQTSWWCTGVGVIKPLLRIHGPKLLHSLMNSTAKNQYFWLIFSAMYS